MKNPNKQGNVLIFTKANACKIKFIYNSMNITSVCCIIIYFCYIIIYIHFIFFTAFKNIHFMAFKNKTSHSFDGSEK